MGERVAGIENCFLESELRFLRMNQSQPKKEMKKRKRKKRWGKKESIGRRFWILKVYEEMKKQGILMNYKHFIRWESGQKRGMKDQRSRWACIIKTPIIHVKRFGLYPEAIGGIQLGGSCNNPDEKRLRSDRKPGGRRREYEQLDGLHKRKDRIKDKTQVLTWKAG